MENSNITVGLSRTLEQFISEIDVVEKYIGRVLVFHDDEVHSVNIDRDGTVKVRLWTWSDVDYEHYVLLIYEILYIFAIINYEKMR